MATQNTTTTSIFLLQNPNSTKTNKGSISLGFFLEVFPNQPYTSIPELVHSAQVLTRQVRFELVCSEPVTVGTRLSIIYINTFQDGKTGWYLSGRNLLAAEQVHSEPPLRSASQKHPLT